MTRRDADTATPESQNSPSRRLFLGGALAGATALAAPVVSAAPAEAASRRLSARGARNIVYTARRQYAGRIPYVYGGSHPRRGFDCSGMTQWLYRRQGVSLPRTARAQYSYMRKISRSRARAGDLVFFFSRGRVTHVGIYMGGNMMVDAGNPRSDISYRRIYTSNVAFGTLR